MNLKTFFKKIIAITLGLNFLVQLIWLFGFHNERLLLLVATGLSLLAMFFFNERTKTGTQFKILIICSILFGLTNFLESGFLVRAIFDLCTFGVISSVFLIRRIGLKQLKNLFYFIIAFSLIYFAYTLSLMDFMFIGANVAREGAFRQFGSETINEGGAGIGVIVYQTQQYIVGVFSLSLLLFPLYYDKNKIKIQWIIFVLILSFIGVFVATYQKRQQLLELAIILLIFIFFYRKLLLGFIPKSRIFSAILLSVIILFGVSLDIFTATIERLNNSLDNINSFDRITELRHALAEFSVLEVIFGMGIGSKIEGTVGGNNLHIGYGTLLMKGGLFLLVFYFVKTVSNIIYCYKMTKINPVYNVGIAVSVFSLIQLSYAPGWSWYLTSLITGLAMFSRYFLNSFINNKNY